jgi:hypothetical protein
MRVHKFRIKQRFSQKLYYTSFLGTFFRFHRSFRRLKKELNACFISYSYIYLLSIIPTKVTCNKIIVIVRVLSVMMPNSEKGKLERKV